MEGWKRGKREDERAGEGEDGVCDGRWGKAEEGRQLSESQITRITRISQIRVV